MPPAPDVEPTVVLPAPPELDVVETAAEVPDEAPDPSVVALLWQLDEAPPTLELAGPPPIPVADIPVVEVTPLAFSPTSDVGVR
jgi:hypothetical protein